MTSSVCDSYLKWFIVLDRNITSAERIRNITPTQGLVIKYTGCSQSPETFEHVVVGRIGEDMHVLHMLLNS